MTQKNIILTGFMGTGKSVLGRLLARRLHYQFVDTDQLIEARIDQSISELFAKQGESAFRQLETQLVEELAERSGLVIATGGGLMLNPANVAKLVRSGRIFCLTASAEEILARISRQPHSRPLLQGPAPLSKIKELLAQRAASYQQFPQISTSNLALEQIIEQLLQLIEDEVQG